MTSNTEEEIMLQIQNTLVTLDMAEVFFCCDLESCHGECCIEGDAGAPITEAERCKIEAVLREIEDSLLPAAKKVIAEDGVAYVDEEGDLVTSIIEGKNCVFTSYDKNGCCMCAIEKAFREGKTDFRKPISCYLYPVRITDYPSFTAVNYHRWKICKKAETLGRKLGVRLYQFLKDPLIERFGEEWYNELCEACEAYLDQYYNNGCNK